VPDLQIGVICTVASQLSSGPIGLASSYLTLQYLTEARGLVSDAYCRVLRPRERRPDQARAPEATGIMPGVSFPGGVPLGQRAHHGPYRTAPHTIEPMGQGQTRHSGLAVLVLIALFVGACGGNSSPSTAADRASSQTPNRTYPPVPSGGTDCGTYDAMTGWPTTIPLGPTTYSCLTEALSSGRPARLVLISPSDVDSGRKTSDGYPIPAGILVTYRVLGPGRLQVTTDRHEARGSVSVQNCAGLSQPAPESPPVPSGCQPG
jgi:hypothetical protein